MKQFQLASAIFLKEFLRLVDLSSLNIESIDERIEQLKTQILLNQQFNGFIKEEENYNPLTKWSEQENLSQQKTKKKQTNQIISNGKQYFQCGKCSKKFNHPSSLSRHKKNQHTNIKQDLIELKQLQTQQQEIVINLTDLQN
ncbi:unnamed protein product (macronuclear) [Paramecium tetraurelia]|uniref:C2H2-type domain-containing protein n=1 Tax=Paramecium tetraurelia TaxID=5888 RepID=A0DVZ5_PARTE|nr:uncharacterized protein GSPATT00020865001 [Paramecium tetraurelia]CAK87212.1 unnamed protein product [Paramecium tetraurelia]|eukprot:XP_001454609.1 hypothetical protein (macronuclear) [Paramecium tetraurelia strain d4-2]